MKPLKDIKPADSDALPKWFTPIWAELRRTFLIGTFVAGILIAFLNWYKATFPSKDPATTEQLNHQSDAIKGRVDGVGAMIHEAFRHQNDSLQSVRADIEESMVKPVLESILDLKRNQRLLMQAQRITTGAIDEQKNAQAQTTDELLRLIRERPEDPEKEEMRKMIKDMHEQLEEIREQMPAKRTSKGKF